MSAAEPSRLLREEKAMGIAAHERDLSQKNGAFGLRADLTWLLILVAVAVLLRGWQLTHTEVASRDSIGYIRIAWQLEHDAWARVLPHAQQHPGYPVALLGMSLPVRRFVHGDLPFLMQISAQFTSALASIFLVFPTYYLGRELFNRKIGFWAALLFQCLPSSGRGMGDGLSEPFFLLGASTALVFACNALRRGSLVSFALAGAFSGLAYLTRPEGLLIAGLTGIVLLSLQISRRWHRPRRRVLAGGICLALGTVAVGGPYAWTIGGLTVKHTAKQLGNDAFGGLMAHGAAPPSFHSGPMLAVWWEQGDTTLADQRAWWSLMSLLEMLSKAFFYFFWAPALLGLWLFRDRFRVVPGTWVLALLCAIVTFLLYRVAKVLGYLSDRHALLIVLGGNYFAVAALDWLGQSAAGLLRRIRPSLIGTSWVDGRRWSIGVLLAGTLCLLPRTLERLHVERSGFREAGSWLAQHTLPGDFVLDPYCWAHYFAGRVFTEGVEGLPAQQPAVWYLVVEESANKHTRLREHQASLVLRHYGKPIRHWDVFRGKEPAKIVVYEVLASAAHQASFSPPTESNNAADH
jgi:hypothetical protein